MSHGRCQLLLKQVTLPPAPQLLPLLQLHPADGCQRPAMLKPPRPALVALLLPPPLPPPHLSAAHLLPATLLALALARVLALVRRQLLHRAGVCQQTPLELALAPVQPLQRLQRLQRHAAWQAAALLRQALRHVQVLLAPLQLLHQRRHGGVWIQQRRQQASKRLRH